MSKPIPPPQDLSTAERIFHRDQLRAARYAALADSEGFQQICFALEALGMRLHGKKADLGTYGRRLKQLAKASEILSEFAERFPSNFTTFDALFEAVRTARNDAMHTGVYARHATQSAIELCVGLEAAIMKDRTLTRHQVKHYMVKSPVSVAPWQPVAHARQLMLTHSFSFLPVKHDGWHLLSETSLARYLQLRAEGRPGVLTLLAAKIEDAAKDGLTLSPALTVGLDDEIQTLLAAPTGQPSFEPRLWLVVDATLELCGVLSPFELM